MKPPLPNSYWVEPGRLLAGEHPDGGGEAATRARIAKLLGAGVDAFIDLTQQGELPSYQLLLPEGVIYRQLSVQDHSVPDSTQQMRGIQQELAQLLMRAHTTGGAVYVHCRAGIGRTGTVVGCYLREQGEAPDAALELLNALWQHNARAARWPRVPETEEQEAYVLGWSAASSAGARERGCFIGLAVGDALANAASGSGQLAWTDDTGMALCVAHSLLERGGFDGRDQIDRFRSWAQDPAAAGADPAATLRPLVQNVLARALWNRSAVLGSHDPSQLDPSPLGRCAAVALFAAGRKLDAAALGADVARVTHQAPVVVDACRLFSVMLCLAVSGAPRATVLAADASIGAIPLRDELRALAASWRAGPAGRHRPPAGVLGTLDRAVRCFARSSSFEEGMERALQSRDADRDALCAAYGALAGAFHGEASIGVAHRNSMAGVSLAASLADQLRGDGEARRGAAG